MSPKTKTASKKERMLHKRLRNANAPPENFRNTFSRVTVNADIPPSELPEGSPASHDDTPPLVEYGGSVHDFSSTSQVQFYRDVPYPYDHPTSAESQPVFPATLGYQRIPEQNNSLYLLSHTATPHIPLYHQSQSTGQDLYSRSSPTQYNSSTTQPFTAGDRSGDSQHFYEVSTRTYDYTQHSPPPAIVSYVEGYAPGSHEGSATGWQMHYHDEDTNHSVDNNHDEQQSWPSSGYPDIPRNDPSF